MLTLNDIWEGGHSANQEKKMNGKILWEEDGWFEGLSEEEFLFGKYCQNETITLYRIPLDPTKKILCHETSYTTHGYEGPKEIVEGTTTSYLGKGLLFIEQSDKLRETTEAEIFFLKKEIETVKDNLSSFSQEFYQKKMAERKKSTSVKKLVLVTSEKSKKLKASK